MLMPTKFGLNERGYDCWLDANGKWTYQYKGSWNCNETGWWYEDESGWYASGCWQKINGKWYYFNESGYMATSQYIGDYWVGSNGDYQENYIKQ